LQGECYRRSFSARALHVSQLLGRPPIDRTHRPNPLRSAHPDPPPAARSASSSPTQAWPARMTMPLRLTMRSTPIASPGSGAGSGEPGEVVDRQVRAQRVDPGAVDEQVDDIDIGPEPERIPGPASAEPELCPGHGQVPTRGSAGRTRPHPPHRCPGPASEPARRLNRRLGQMPCRRRQLSAAATAAVPLRQRSKRGLHIVAVLVEVGG